MVKISYVSERKREISVCFLIFWLRKLEGKYSGHAGDKGEATNSSWGKSTFNFDLLGGGGEGDEGFKNDSHVWFQ